MMLTLALLSFATSAIWSAVDRSWPLALLAAGYALVLADAHPTLSL